MQKAAAIKLPEPLYKVRVDTSGRGHKVYIAGDPMPLLSVTKAIGLINKPALVGWAARMATEDIYSQFLEKIAGKSKVMITKAWMQSACERAKGAHYRKKVDAGISGTACHDAFERVTMGEPLNNLPKELRGPADACLEWLKGSGIQIVGRELEVGSREWQYGGICDVLAIRDGKYGVVDYKTSNGIYAEVAFQATAYARALEEQYGIKVEWCDVVRFSKEEPYGFEACQILEMDEAFQIFLDVLDGSKRIPADYRKAKAKFISTPTHSTFEAIAAKAAVKKKIAKGDSPW